MCRCKFKPETRKYLIHQKPSKGWRYEVYKKEVTFSCITPLDTRRKLNVRKTCRRPPGRLILCPGGIVQINQQILVHLPVFPVVETMKK